MREVPYANSLQDSFNQFRGQEKRRLRIGTHLIFATRNNLCEAFILVDEMDFQTCTLTLVWSKFIQKMRAVCPPFKSAIMAPVVQSQTCGKYGQSMSWNGSKSAAPWYSNHNFRWQRGPPWGQHFEQDRNAYKGHVHQEARHGHFRCHKRDKWGVRHLLVLSKWMVREKGSWIQFHGDILAK